MKTSLKLAGAALFGLVLGIAGTQGLQAQQEMKRTALQHADLTGVPGTEVYMTLIEAPPGTAFPSHTHPGDEFSYLIDGAIELDVAGKPPLTVKAGDSIHVERGKVHGGKVVGNTPAKLLAVHIVDKGKPLSEPAK